MSKEVRTPLGRVQEMTLRKEKPHEMSTLVRKSLVSYSFFFVWWISPHGWVPNNSWALPSLWMFFPIESIKGIKQGCPLKRNDITNRTTSWYTNVRKVVNVGIWLTEKQACSYCWSPMVLLHAACCLQHPYIFKQDIQWEKLQFGLTPG